jgi:drug/metabolite transporter (DMT)-like permease
MSSSGLSRWPALRGGFLAVAAATLFGVSTPLVQRSGEGVGPFTTAALLYAGAALLGAAMRKPAAREAKLLTTDWPRLVAMAVFGAVIGPVALAWGLQHTSGTSASLMLALEAVFTALLARMLYHESMDKRVAIAMTLLLAGAIVLITDRSNSGETQLWGLLAVFLATFAWGVDNTLSRGVAERDPSQVVLAKSALGAVAATLLALAWNEPVPAAGRIVALLAVGATGYGLSLRMYLLAQRAFGAARTGSVFAFAPFIGAAAAIALGDQGLSLGMAAGGLLMLIGVGVHLYESHEHEHLHQALLHEHAHVHDDGHHTHEHDVMPAGPHSHEHRHKPTRHAHPHVPDAHHVHRH